MGSLQVGRMSGDANDAPGGYVATVKVLGVRVLDPAVAPERVALVLEELVALLVLRDEKLLCAKLVHLDSANSAPQAAPLRLGEHRAHRRCHAN
jgi:hypothetical protein